MTQILSVNTNPFIEPGRSFLIKVSAADTEMLNRVLGGGVKEVTYVHNLYLYNAQMYNKRGSFPNF
jgi:hypothetical protein